MMADLRLTDKPANKKGLHSAFRSLFGSLVQRIALICAIFIILPLIIYAILLVVFSSHEMQVLHKDRLIIHLAGLLFLLVLFGGMASFLLAKRMARPLNQLYQVMEKVAAGQLDARFQKDAFGFELNIVGSDLNVMINSLIAQVKRIEEEILAKQLVEKELLIGHEMQKNLFPNKIEEKSFEIASRFYPAKYVSGDFFDLFEDLQTNRLLFTVADAVDKGISACLYSFSVRSLLRASFCSQSSLETTIKLVNNLFYLDTSRSSSFVTAWIGSYDCKTRILEYSSAGHYPAFLVRDKVYELATEGSALGVITLDRVAIGQVSLEIGDLLVLFSDGLIDALGAESLKKAILETAKQPCETIAKTILEQISDYDDDITLLILRAL